MDHETFSIPEFCPTCSGSVTLEGDFLYCRSKSCPSRLSGSVKSWVNKLGVLQWGDAFIDSLTNPDDPKVSSIADLYRLSAEDMAPCCSGIKVARKCWESLQRSKKMSLELMLSGLNIQNLGLSTATDIVTSGLDTVEKVISAGYDDFLKIPNVGEITARQVFDGIQERRDAILDLSTVLDIQLVQLGPLSGKSFCITGNTSKPRKSVQKDIMDSGGIVKESVGSGLTYLITNEDPSFESSKMTKAKKYGTQIISENVLYDLISGG